jgi:hypothetical protein
MELKLVRKVFSSTSTISDLFVNDVFLCNVLEDVDRGLTSSMSLSEIKATKQKTKTAIPYGTYLVANTFSPRFQKYLPLLLNVPGFDGIRIHPGNIAADTDGCLLPGMYTAPNTVTSSRINFTKLFSMIKAVEKKEKITITIVKE